MIRNKTNFTEKQIERNDAFGLLNKIHGFANKEKLYGVWKAMRERCHNPNNKRYKNYGGRGIKVCEVWQCYVSFRTWAFTSGYQEGLTIDRIDNDGNYEPSNCKWSTWEEQRWNKQNTIADYVCPVCGNKFRRKQLSVKTCSRKCGYILRGTKNAVSK